jgi:DNA/RNA-binding domain of Phe-tRNA-synthetase-like protein
MEPSLWVAIEDELRRLCPAIAVGVLEARVRERPAPGLQAEIDEVLAAFAGHPIDRIKNHPAIDATRALYRDCGKDPSRYRPAAEQLRRRAAQGKGLYRVGTLVDLINLVSLRTGLSIGAFDLDAIDGDAAWGIGRAGEPYEAIGRGPLNIAGLPVLRDRRGAFGSPTSDSERTRLQSGTTRFLLSVNSYDGPDPALAALDLAADLLRRHADATDIRTAVVR